MVTTAELLADWKEKSKDIKFREESNYHTTVADSNIIYRYLYMTDDMKDVKISDNGTNSSLNSCNYLAVKSCIKLCYTLENIDSKKIEDLNKWIAFLHKCKFNNIEHDEENGIIYYVPKMEWSCFFESLDGSLQAMAGLRFTLITWAYLRSFFCPHKIPLDFTTNVLKIHESTKLKPFKALLIGTMKSPYFWVPGSSTWFPIGSTDNATYVPAVFELETIDKAVEIYRKRKIDKSIPLNYFFSSQEPLKWIKESKNFTLEDNFVLFTVLINNKSNRSTLKKQFNITKEFIINLLSKNKYLTLIKELGKIENLPFLNFNSLERSFIIFNKKKDKEIKVNLQKQITSFGIVDFVITTGSTHKKKVDLNKHEFYAERYLSRLRS